jgi:hypothetical protein
MHMHASHCLSISRRPITKNEGFGTYDLWLVQVQRNRTHGVVTAVPGLVPSRAPRRTRRSHGAVGAYPSKRRYVVGEMARDLPPPDPFRAPSGPGPANARMHRRVRALSTERHSEKLWDAYVLAIRKSEP